jgi:hypothetical protein
MIVPIVRGKTELIQDIPNGEILDKACLNCQNDLALKYLRTWRTVFFIPMIPTNEKRFAYECVSCKKAYDPVYREYFINKAKYQNTTSEQLMNLNNEFSLLILASILTTDKTALTEHKEILKNFSENTLNNKQEFELLFDIIGHGEGTLDERVFNYYGVYRDCFVDELRSNIFRTVLIHCKSLKLSIIQQKKLYIFARHWGMTKEEFDKFTR